MNSFSIIILAICGWSFFSAVLVLAALMLAARFNQAQENRENRYIYQPRKPTRLPSVSAPPPPPLGDRHE